MALFENNQLPRETDFKAYATYSSVFHKGHKEYRRSKMAEVESVPREARPLPSQRHVAFASTVRVDPLDITMVEDGFARDGTDSASHTFLEHFVDDMDEQRLNGMKGASENHGRIESDDNTERGAASLFSRPRLHSSLWVEKELRQVRAEQFDAVLHSADATALRPLATNGENWDVDTKRKQKSKTLNVDSKRSIYAGLTPINVSADAIVDKYVPAVRPPKKSTPPVIAEEMTRLRRYVTRDLETDAPLRFDPVRVPPFNPVRIVFDNNSYLRRHIAIASGFGHAS